MGVNGSVGETLGVVLTGTTGLDMVAMMGGLATLAGVTAYLAYALKRWPPRGALLASGLIGTALLLGSAALAAFTSVRWAVGPAVAALCFAHLGAACARGRSAAQRRANLKATPADVPAPRRSAAPAPQAAAAPSSQSSSASWPPTNAPADRATLGRYRIERQLGRGAMGAVYLGRDPNIGRQVAIKTMALSREFEGEALAEARGRFFREAETAGRLQHRDIVTIFDAGEDQDLAFIAMEYLRGHDLTRHTTSGALLPPASVLEIAARVADALAYAHSQGVVHRDIKPANVMIDLAAGTVKVTDFGIARITDSSRTRTGVVLGTPSYMSPEQMAGLRVDGRSDLYSLGVMLFQLLTGALPHRAESMAKLMYEIANVPAADVRSLRPELPEALADVVALALEKRPEVRYASGRQMADDLRTVLASLAPQPIAAAEPATSPPAPQDSAFAATVKFDRGDPRHNAGL